MLPGIKSVVALAKSQDTPGVAMPLGSLVNKYYLAIKILTRSCDFDSSHPQIATDCMVKCQKSQLNYEVLLYSLAT